MSCAIPVNTVSRRNKTVKKKFMTKKSGLFNPKKYTRMSEPTTVNNPLAAQIPETPGHNLTSRPRLSVER